MTDLFTQPTTGSANPDNAAYTSDGKPDQYGRYRVPNLTSGRVVPWTRATTFAKTISDTYTLNMWGRRMVIVGLITRPDLLEEARGLDVREDRDALNRIAEKASEAAGSKGAANVGTALHGFTEQADRGEADLFVPAPWDRDIAAYRASLEAESIVIVPGMIERLIVCSKHQVAGTFDRIIDDTEHPCSVCGKTVKIGDLKTGADLDYGWLEIAVQLAVYANADAIWDKEGLKYEEMPDVCRHTAVVMHLPANPRDEVNRHTCTIYDLDVEKGWAIAGLCADVRNARKVRNLATPRRRTVAVGEPTEVASSGPTILDRIDAARTVEELSELWVEGTKSGAWTEAHTQRGLARRAAILAG
jgi:hypothetical protein